MGDKPKDRKLWHQSGVNKAMEPFVQLILDNNVIAQMTPEECRDHARTMYEAAEAAETDAFLMQWATKVVGVGVEEAGRLLVEMRLFREQWTGKKYGAQSKTDWVFPVDFTKKQ
jgi:hypothetical protein